jgi:tetratricopeptide (TPR) repeat protein
MQGSLILSRKFFLCIILAVFIFHSGREISLSQSTTKPIPQDAQKHYQLGSEYYFAENYIAAYNEYTAAIKRCNYYFWAYLSRGYTLTKINRLQEAESDFTNALDLDSKSVDAYICRGLVRKEIQSYEGAIQDFSRAIEIKPTFPDSYNNRGILKSFLKDYEGAIADFDKAIEIDDRFGEAYFNRGAAKYNLKEITAACEDFNIAYGLGVKQSTEMIIEHCQ